MLFLFWETTRKFNIGALLGLLLLPILACNALGNGNITPSTTPLPAGATESPADSTNVAPTVEPIPSELPPTETPLNRPTFVPTPTNAPLDPTPTLASSVTNTPTNEDFSPLTFVWDISWEVDENNPGMATATITVIAAGGSGQYTYYHDDILQEGPVFSYQWATCKPRPGSVRVDSSDGQSVKEDYFERSPCPATNTPTP